MNIKRELFSAPTRDAFRDAAISVFKHSRVNCFEQLTEAGIKPVGLPDNRVPTFGELLEGYYAAVDWKDQRSIAPFIPVFEEIYCDAPENVWGHKEELTERLFQDGLHMSRGRLAKLPI